MHLYPINITNFKVDGGAMFGTIPKTSWQKLYPADENNLCNWALRSLLVVYADKKILIDNGFGNKQSKDFFNKFQLNGDYSLRGSLKKYGFNFDDITDVVLTHLHYDHCGGGVKYNKDKTAYEITFKNANYWVSEQQWDTAVNPDEREADSFLNENILPMKESGQLNLVNINTELFPNFYIRLYNGHTKGQIIPFIKIKNKTLVYTADLIPSTAHIALQNIMSYDIYPSITLKEKKEFLNEAAKNNYILFFEHDLYHECCTVQETKKGIKIKDIFYLSKYFVE